MLQREVRARVEPQRLSLHRAGGHDDARHAREQGARLPARRDDDRTRAVEPARVVVHADDAPGRVEREPGRGRADDARPGGRARAWGVASAERREQRGVRRPRVDRVVRGRPRGPGDARPEVGLAAARVGDGELVRRETVHRVQGEDATEQREVVRVVGE